MDFAVFDERIKEGGVFASFGTAHEEVVLGSTGCRRGAKSPAASLAPVGPRKSGFAVLPGPSLHQGCGGMTGALRPRREARIHPLKSDQF